MNSNSHANEKAKPTKAVEPVILSITGGTKAIAAEFVTSCKKKPVHVLKKTLKTEIGNLHASVDRPAKYEKSVNRVNIVLNTICKKENVSNMEAFEKNSLIKSLSEVLEENKLSMIVTQNGQPVESRFTTPMKSVQSKTTTAIN